MRSEGEIPLSLNLIQFQIDGFRDSSMLKKELDTPNRWTTA